MLLVSVLGSEVRIAYAQQDLARQGETHDAEPPKLPFKAPEDLSPTAGSGADDTPVFEAIISQGFNIRLLPGKTYRLNGLTLNGNTIECGGLGGRQAGVAQLSRLITGNAKLPAGPAIIMKGWGSQLRNCSLGDPNNYSLIRSKLSRDAPADAGTVLVDDPTNFLPGRLAFVTLDDGLIWPMKIAAVTGSQIKFVEGDRLPSRATAGQFVQSATGVVRIDASRGQDFPNGTIFNHLDGAVFNAQPLAMEVVNTDSNPAAHAAYNQQSVISNTFTYYTSLLPIWLDANVTNYQFINVQLWGHPEVTTKLAAPGQEGDRAVQLVDTSDVGESISILLDNGRIWPVSGTVAAGDKFSFSEESKLPHSAASGNKIWAKNYASTSFLQDGRGSTVAYGGHNGVNLLGIQAMNGFIFRGANLSSFTNVVSDVPNGVLVDQVSQWLSFHNIFTTAQNGNPTSGLASLAGSYGFKVSGNSVQILLNGLQSFGGGSAKSLWIDPGSIVFFNSDTWSGNRSIGGAGDYIGGAHPMLQVKLRLPQSLRSGEPTKVLFDSVAIDTGKFWNGDSKRWRPQVAGWYQVSMTLTYSVNSPAVDQSRNFAFISKNEKKVALVQIGRAENHASVAIPPTKVYLNGSTDYIEGAISLNGVGAEVGGGGEASVLGNSFEATYLGP